MAMIAIIDDDAFVREALDDLITSVGHQVRTYESAARFLESGEVADTAFLITDLQMPGMSGLDRFRNLLSGEKPPPQEGSGGAKKREDGAAHGRAVLNVLRY